MPIILVYTYILLHGSMDFMDFKYKIFPDKQWESKCSVWYGLLIWFGLSLYWIALCVIINQESEPSNWYIGMYFNIYI